MSNAKHESKGFFASIKQGYDEQDKAISREKEKADAQDRSVDGIVTGLVEGVLNPARWIFSIFR